MLTGHQKRGQLISVIAQENQKLAIFLFHHLWKCTLNLEVIGVNVETVHLQAGQNKLKDKHKDPNMLANINKSDITGTMKAIKEYLRSSHGIVRVPLAHVNRKTIKV